MQVLASRRIQKIVLATVLLLALGFAGMCVFGPYFLEKLIISKMQAAGLEKPRITVVAVSHKGLDLREISARNPEFAIDFIHVGYTVSSLLKGRVKDIVISGIKYSIDFDQNRLENDSSSSRPSLGTSFIDNSFDSLKQADLPDLFFDRIDIRSADLEVFLENTRHRISAEAFFAAENQHRFNFTINPRIYGLPFEIQGQADLAALKTSGHIRSIAPGLSGTWSMDMRSGRESGLEIAAIAEDLKFSGLGIQAGLENASFQAAIEFNDHWGCREAAASLKVKGLFLNQAELDFLDLSIKDKGRAVSLNAGLNRPFRASAHITGTQSDIFQILETRQWQTGLDWQINAEMDSDEASFLLPIDVKVKPMIRFDSRGRLEAGLSGNNSGSGSSSDPGEWFADLSAEKIEIAPVNVLIPEPLVEIYGLGFSGTLSLKGGPGGWKVRMPEKNRVAVNRVISKNSGNQIELSAMSWESQTGKDFLSAGFSENGLMHAGWAVSADNPIECSFPGGKLHSETVLFDGNCRMAADGDLQATSRARAEIGIIQMSSPDLEIRDIEVDIPFALNHSESEPGWFSAPVIRYQNISLPAVTGKATVGFYTKAGIAGPMLRPALELTVEDGSISGPETGVVAEGINCNILIKDLLPLTTPGSQRIDISRLALDALELKYGFLVFSLEPGALFLEKTRWKMPGGGTVEAYASRVAFEPLHADLDIFFEHVDLVDLVSRFSEEKIVGSGRVFGRVPVQWSPERIDIGKGYLYSVPGTGRFGIKDEKWLDALMLYVREAMAGHKYLSLVSERMEQALRDFEYNFLSVELEPGNGDTAASIELRGKGLRGESPQEVGSLVINVNSIEEILNRLLRFYQTKQQSIEQALDSFFEDSVDMPPAGGK